MSPERRVQFDTSYEPDSEVWHSRTFSYAHPKIGTEAICHHCELPIKCIGLNSPGGDWKHLFREENAGSMVCQASCDAKLSHVPNERNAHAFAPCPLPKDHKGKHLWRRIADLEREG